jgi:hypothetical protein
LKDEILKLLKDSTPGPWRLHESADKTYVLGPIHTDELAAEFHRGTYKEPKPWERDANLVSNTPVIALKLVEVLELLEEIQWDGERKTNTCPVCHGNPDIGHYSVCKLNTLLFSSLEKNMNELDEREKVIDETRDGRSPKGNCSCGHLTAGHKKDGSCFYGGCPGPCDADLLSWVVE